MAARKKAAPVVEERPNAAPGGRYPRTLLVSDLHLEEKSAETCWQVLRAIPIVMQKERIEHVVFLGDFFMVRHVFFVELLVKARELLAPISGRGMLRIDVVPGNHDQHNREGRHLLEVFEGLPGFRVHTEAAIVPGFGAFLPWRYDNAEQIAHLARLADPDNNPRAILYGHAAVLGAMMNNLRVDDAGIPIGAFVPFKHVFLGHYHGHQRIEPNVTYVGSPYQTSYAEAGQRKGFVVFDGERYHQHELTIGRRHFKLEIDADNPRPFSLDGVKPGDKLWVVCRGQMANTMKDQVAKAVDAAGIEVDRFDVDLKPVEGAARIKFNPGETFDDVSNRFVDAQPVDDAFRGMLKETWNRLKARKP